MSERVLWVGDMARDDAAVERLRAVVNVVGRHQHPGLIDKAQARRGEYFAVDYENIQHLGELAVITNSTLAVVTNDKLLANGAVNELLLAKPDLKVVGPNKWLARLESDKEQARLWIDDIDPSLNPIWRKAQTEAELRDGLDDFKSIGKEVAVKPIGPAGGRGVKVMGKNLDTYGDALNHGRDILNRQDQKKGILLEEALEGVEFNLQIMTDGRVLIRPPVTVDYSYRDDGNVGPPTGGMGSFSYAPGEIPNFMTAEDYEQAMTFSQKLLERAQAEYQAEFGDDQHFSGVLYPNFIMTAQGLKVIEINARPGDPEWMNIEQVVDENVDIVDVYSRMATQDLSDNDVRFVNQSSVAQYFVPPDYAREKGDQAVEFYLNHEALSQHEVDLYFSSAERYTDHYRTVGSSRTYALATKGKDPGFARYKIMNAHHDGGAKNLDYRREIGHWRYIKNLKDPR
ncbi:MAG TPA: hypothetical protein VLF39_04565 [Candidatus Saccharimonadales bacterium]|nr:hypothetical protein [Candidatus Saccharimonadales bacterium]